MAAASSGGADPSQPRAYGDNRSARTEDASGGEGGDDGRRAVPAKSRGPGLAVAKIAKLNFPFKSSKKQLI